MARTLALYDFKPVIVAIMISLAFVMIVSVVGFSDHFVVLTLNLRFRLQ